MFNRFHFMFAMVFLCLVGPPGVAASSVSPNIPLDSWVYPALDKLAGLGLIRSSLQGTRPVSRREAARQILEAREQLDAAHSPPVAFELLGRLEQEMETFLSEAGGQPGSGYWPRLRELRFETIYQEGAPSTASPAAANNALQHALNVNNFGLDFGEGFNALASFETDARLRSFFLLHWRPLVQVDEDDADLTTLQGTATLGLGPVQLMAGRESLWWGQGTRGSLVLTNNAKPLDLLRITNPSPLHLPWVFRHLGPVRFDLFWSRLEADRVVPEPYFAGARFNFKPFPWLELGAARTVIFGGEGRPEVELSEFLTILTGHNLSGEGDTSNQLAAVDARLKLVPLWGVELYGELGGEDEAGWFLAKKVFLAGLYLPRLEPSGRLGLRFEYADLNFQGHGPVWYQHSQYRSGYTYEKNILGHHVGGDARAYFGAIEWFLPGGGLVRTGADLQRRGLSHGIVERHLQPFLQVELPLGDSCRLSAAYAFDHVENAGYRQGNEDTGHLARIGIVRRW